MRVCFVNDTFLLGRGVDTVIYEIARRLGKKYKVKVICGKGFCNYKPENFEIEEIDMGKAFTGSFKDLLFPIKLLKLRKFLRKYNKFTSFNTFFWTYWHEKCYSNLPWLSTSLWYLKISKNSN
jgi:hypothetical protein